MVIFNSYVKLPEGTIYIMVLQLWVHTAVHSPIDINVLFFSDKNTGSQLTIIYIYRL